MKYCFLASVSKAQRDEVYEWITYSDSSKIALIPRFNRRGNLYPKDPAVGSQTIFWTDLIVVRGNIENLLLLQYGHLLQAVEEKL